MTNTQKTEIISYILANGRQCFWHNACPCVTEYAIYFPDDDRHIENGGEKMELYCFEHMLFVNRYDRVTINIKTGDIIRSVHPQ